MNKCLEKLYQIGRKDSRYIIGLMSGTSLDGLDVALCEIKGHGLDTKLSLLKFTTVNYAPDFKEEVKTIFSKRNIDLQQLCLLNEWIAIKHAIIVNECLAHWQISNEKIDLIASHGQTVYHAPRQVHQDEKFSHGSLQIGDGDHLAVHTGIITISDFRQKHLAHGGEGAPLAAYGDFVLFSEKKQSNLLLNIGGIANLTYLPAGASFDEITCSDIGPGNTLMDAFVQQYFPGKYFDNNGNIASSGKVNELLLQTLEENDFFKMPFPKTTGPELFNLFYLESAMHTSNTIHIALPDVLATLNKFTALMISKAIQKITAGKNVNIFVSGGGMHNALLMEHISKNLPGISIESTTEKNINPDAKEAILFALLANETIAGNKENFGVGTTSYPATGMGKISFPF